jgi:hypothetical protein
MFKSSLRQEIIGIVVIKLLILFLIKFLWFANPTTPEFDTQHIVEHVLSAGEKPYEGEPR